MRCPECKGELIAEGNVSEAFVYYLQSSELSTNVLPDDVVFHVYTIRCSECPWEMNLADPIVAYTGQQIEEAVKERLQEYKK